MTTANEPDLSSDRICGQSAANLDHLECLICQKVLWKPVACQTCETPFCSSCIHQWLAKNPTRCPNQCEPFVERRCPPLTAKLLSQLQIICSYRSNGCQQIIPYEALDKHESNCEYQLRQCSGCRLQLLRKDYSNHLNECSLIELTCDECKLSYRRGDASNRHTESKCIKEQFRQVRDECKEMRLMLNCIITNVTFTDLPYVTESTPFPDIYKGLHWIQFRYIDKTHALKKYPNSGYIAACKPDVCPYIVWSSKESEINCLHSNETFALVSLTIYAAWNDNLQLTVKGYRNSNEINRCTITLLFGKPQRIVFGWKHLDQVTFEPFGGTPHSDSGRLVSSLHFVISQLTIC